DHEVTGEDDLESSGECEALHRRDQRCGGGRLGQSGEPATGKRRDVAAGERLEVHAGAERSRGSVDDPDAKFWVRVELVDRRGDAERHRPVDGVVPTRTVETDLEDGS